MDEQSHVGVCGPPYGLVPDGGVNASRDDALNINGPQWRRIYALLMGICRLDVLPAPGDVSAMTSFVEHVELARRTVAEVEAKPTEETVKVQRLALLQAASLFPAWHDPPLGI